MIAPRKQYRTVLIFISNTSSVVNTNKKHIAEGTVPNCHFS
jgi:hypothetical protein